MALEGERPGQVDRIAVVGCAVSNRDRIGLADRETLANCIRHGVEVAGVRHGVRFTHHVLVLVTKGYRVTGPCGDNVDHRHAFCRLQDNFARPLGGGTANLRRIVQLKLELARAVELVLGEYRGALVVRFSGDNDLWVEVDACRLADVGRGYPLGRDAG